MVKSRLAQASDAEKKDFMSNLCFRFGDLIKTVEIKPKPVQFASVMKEQQGNAELIKVRTERTQSEAKAIPART